MGYSTEFSGVIHIENVSLDVVRDLKAYLGSDKRDLVSSGVMSREEAESLGYTHYCDLKLTDNLDGLIWDGSEKTYGMEEWLNFLREKCTLELREGDRFLAQGEDIEDRYFLVVENNTVVRRDLTIEGLVACPDCGHKFTTGEKES